MGQLKQGTLYFNSTSSPPENSKTSFNVVFSVKSTIKNENVKIYARGASVLWRKKSK
jgi:hypothetical protein